MNRWLIAILLTGLIAAALLVSDYRGLNQTARERAAPARPDAPRAADVAVGASAPLTPSSSSAPPTDDLQRSHTSIADRLGTATVLGESTPRAVGKDTWEIIRVLQPATGYPVRIVETWTRSTAGAPLEKVAERAMVADHVLIKGDPSALPAGNAPVWGRPGERLSPQSAWRALPLANPADPAAMDVALSTLRSLPEPMAAEPDHLVTLFGVVPNDPLFSSQSVLNVAASQGSINATEGWSLRTDAREIIVAVIDSGLLITHEDLAANIWTHPAEIAGNALDDDRNGYVDDVYGYNFYSRTADNTPSSTHGTAVGGIIGAVGNNAKGIAGVAWRVQLMPVAIFAPNGYARVSDSAAAIDYAIANGATVINASYGGSMRSSVEEEAVQRARAAGIIIVAAAGNEGANLDFNPVYPACYPYAHVISVGASSGITDIPSWSNRGATTVDLLAPGTNILSTTFDAADPNAYANRFSGTSFSAPLVTGAVALIKARFPTESWDRSINRLYAGVRKYPWFANATSQGGILDLEGALRDGVRTPSNDTPESPVDLKIANGAIPGVAASANHGATEPALPAGFVGRTLWYRWTPPVGGIASITANGLNSTARLAVYAHPLSAGSLPLGTSVNRNPSPTLPVPVEFDVVADRSYWVMAEADGAAGEFQLIWEVRPSNDRFVNATRLSGPSFSVKGTNRSAAPETGEPAVSQGGTGLSVWYLWTAPATGPFVIETAGSETDTVLTVYSGSSLGALTLLAANDDVDASGDRTSRVTLSTAANTTYAIRVDSATPGGGPFTLSGRSFSAAQILSQPSDLAANIGDSLRLSAIVTAPAGTRFQWLRNGVEVPGAVNPVLFFPAATVADSGTYQLEVRSPGGNQRTRSASVTVAGRRPLLVQDPASVVIAPGFATRLTALAEGDAPLTYQWFKDQVPLDGTTGPTLPLVDARSSAGSYTVVVSNTVGEARSAAAQVRWVEDGSLVSVTSTVQQSFHPVRHEGGYIVAGGTYSKDGLTWFEGPGVLLSFGNDRWLGLSNYGAITYSGATLDDVKPIPGATAIQADALVFGNGVFVAYYQNGSSIYTSTTGETWRLATTGVSASKIVFTNGRFIAAGDQGAFWSTDGVTWSGDPTFIGYYLSGCGGRAFLRRNGVLWTTVDGATWVPTNIVNPNVRAVAHDGTRFLAEIDGGWASTALTGHYVSTDGITWSALDIPMTGALLGGADGWFWAAGAETYSPVRRFTLDGMEQRTEPLVPKIRQPRFSDGWFTATSTSTYSTVVSPDGVNWQEPGPAAMMSDGVRFNGRFYSGRYSATSRFVGLDHRRRIGDNMVSYTQGNGILLGRSENNSWFRLGTDGLWGAPGGSNPPESSTAISFAAGKFYNGRSSGTWSSPDAVIWTNVSSRGLSDATSYAGSLFAWSGSVYRSANGSSWTTSGAPALSSVSSLFTFENKLWIVANSSVYRWDGSTLVRHPAATAYEGIAAGNGRIVGGNGNLVGLPRTSPPTVRMRSPGFRETFGLGNAIPVSAHVADADGDLDRLEILLDGAVVQTLRVAPWEITLPGASEGWHSIELRAYDRAGSLATTGGEIYVAGPSLVERFTPRDPTLGTTFEFKGRILGIGTDTAPGLWELDGDGFWQSVSRDSAWAVSKVLVTPDRLLTFNNHGVLLSEDGLRWRLTWPPGIGYLSSGLTLAGGLYFAPGDETLISRDGETWVSLSFRLSMVTYSAGTWVGMGPGSRLWVSTDGTRWNCPFRAPNFNIYPAIAPLARGFVALNGSQLYTSPDGTQWTTVNAPVALSTQDRELFSAGGLVFLTGRPPSGGLSYAFVTSDGINWTSLPFSQVKYAEFQDGLWIVGTNAGIYESTDAATWKQLTNISGTGGTMRLMKHRGRPTLVDSTVAGWRNPAGEWTKRVAPVGSQYSAVADHPTSPLLLTGLSAAWFGPDGSIINGPRDFNSPSTAIWDGDRFVVFGKGFGYFDPARPGEISWQRTYGSRYYPKVVRAQGSLVAYGGGVVSVLTPGATALIDRPLITIPVGDRTEYLSLDTIVSDGNSLYGISTQGLFRSTDLAQSWVAIPVVGGARPPLAYRDGLLVYSDATYRLTTATTDGAVLSSTLLSAETVIATDDRFAALLADGRIVVSPDGRSWTPLGTTVAGATRLATIRGTLASLGPTIAVLTDADLSIDALSTPSGNRAAGDILALTATITNRGAAPLTLPPADEWRGSLSPRSTYWSTATASGVDLAIGNVPAHTLAPGASVTVVVSMRIPDDIEAGTHTVGLSIGYTAAFRNETSAANNRLAGPLDGIVIPAWDLNLSVAAGGSVTTSRSLRAIPNGQTVLLSPIASRGYEFAGWSGDIEGSPGLLNLRVDRSRTFAAQFRREPIPVAITQSGEGIIEGAPIGGMATPGTMLQLVAKPAAGWFFAGWNRPTLPRLPTLEIDATTAHGLQARFARTWDGWSRANFSPVQLADSTISRFDADPDHDGVGNLLEYFFGTDPLSPRGQRPPLPTISSQGVIFDLDLPFEARSLAFDLVWSSDLTRWTRLDHTRETLSETNEGERLRLRAPIPDAAGANFFRLEVRAISPP